MSAASAKLIDSQLKKAELNTKTNPVDQTFIINTRKQELEQEIQELQRQRDIYTKRICNDQVRNIFFSSIFFNPFLPLLRPSISANKEHQERIIQKITSLEQEKNKLNETQWRFIRK